MRKKSRPEAPQTLRNKTTEWTNELLDEINRVGEFSKVEIRFKNKYNQNEIKEALQKMYNNLCCYCEAHINPTTTFGQIEHLKPKSKFPDLCFSWDNLHLSCEICNIKKSDKWDAQNPIIDPTLDNSNEHLQYYYDNIKPITKRGITTVNHVELNRQSLTAARRKIVMEVIKLLEQYKETSDDFKKHSLNEELDKIINEESEYYSAAKSVIDKFSILFGL
jgi:uncharacterized protein (TIGR02646 family)